MKQSNMDKRYDFEVRWFTGQIIGWMRSSDQGEGERRQSQMRLRETGRDLGKGSETERLDNQRYVP